jgi:hypothetical protein
VIVNNINYLSPQTIEQKKKHMPMIIQILALDRHKNVVGLKQLMGSQPYSLDQWIPPYSLDQWIPPYSLDQWIPTLLS